MDLEIAGDTALVTASSSGLGKASATALAREGADVVINGRDTDRLQEAKAEVEDIAAGNVVAQRGDLTEPDDIKRLVETTVDEFGELDHLVTSAGGPPSGAFLETTDEEWYDRVSDGERCRVRGGDRGARAGPRVSSSGRGNRSCVGLLRAGQPFDRVLDGHRLSAVDVWRHARECPVLVDRETHRREDELLASPTRPGCVTPAGVEKRRQAPVGRRCPCFELRVALPLGRGGLAGDALFPAHDVEGGEIAPLDQRVKLGADLRVASLGRRRKIASGEQDTRPFGGWHLYLTVLGRT